MKKSQLSLLEASVAGSFELAGFRVFVRSINNYQNFIDFSLLLNETINVEVVVFENKLFLKKDSGPQLLGDLNSDTATDTIKQFYIENKL